MSETLERVARQVIEESWNRGNLDILSSLVTTGFVNNDPINRTTGVEGLRATIAKYRTAFPDCRLDIQDLISAGDDAVIVRWTYSGTQRAALEGIAATGRRVEGSGMTLYRFEGDRIRQADTEWDALGMMQQLGVVTLPGKVARVGA